MCHICFPMPQRGTPEIISIIYCRKLNHNYAGFITDSGALMACYLFTLNFCSLIKQRVRLAEVIPRPSTRFKSAFQQTLVGHISWHHCRFFHL